MLIAFKLKLALLAAAGFATPLAVTPWLASRDATLNDRQAMVELHPGGVAYRVAGDFTRAGRQAEAPLLQLRFDRPPSIMQHQVSSGDYQACVDDSGCRPAPAGTVVRADTPAVQISWRDASAYALWLSNKTGEQYRLPTDAEWAFAAGRLYKDDGLPADSSDPSKRWIARYERESDRDLSVGGEPRPFGSFGINEQGLQDIGGNVWEWTSTCFVRTALDRSGTAQSQNTNCGVRVVEGQHRAYVTDFIRDAKAGGCAVGIPPNNLGFRLVREPRAWLAWPAFRSGTQTAENPARR
jgi:formylglycine-generating enzyme required for sulfatase activity